MTATLGATTRTAGTLSNARECGTPMAALLLDPEGATSPLLAGCVESLRRARIAIHVVRNFDAALALIQAYPVAAGLVRWPAQGIGGENPALGLERLADAAPGLRLVALAEQPVADPAGLARLIRQGSLHDVQYLPVRAETLVSGLCHLGRLSELVRMADAASPASAATLAPADPWMIGSSPAIRRVQAAIKRFGAVDAPVLITGESGTGKEVASRAIHEASRCHKGPFVPINCPGIPATLAESEFFGHEKGAFTGAYQRKIGRVEAARDGTCFLDEIGDLPLEIQGHLLRFLQEKTIQHVGGTQTIPVEVRVTAATNVDLQEAIRTGRFREDLFYRLNVLTLHLPPLRERGDDVLELAEAFLRKFSEESGRPLLGFRQGALAVIRSHPWPGNIRQLMGAIRRAVVMADGRWVTAADLGLIPEGAAHADAKAAAEEGSATLQQARIRAERDAINRSLDRTDYNVPRAARELGVSRVTLYRLMARHEIRPRLK